MEKQRICIIGDGLSGLTTAITLNNLNKAEVHLISDKTKKTLDKRTTAISDSNYKFLKENINSIDNKLFWPSKNIKLFYENRKSKVNFLNFKEEKNNLLYIFENYKYKKLLLKEFKKKKIKKIKKKIENLDQLKIYDLIILCLGGESSLYDKIIDKRSLKKDYKEVAITGYVKHDIKNLSTSQFFLKEGPIAILPFSKDSFSFVWSVNKTFYRTNLKDINNIIKNKIKNILIIKKNIKLTNLQSFPIKMGLKRKYYKNNILILGEGLHTIHPVAGQGFNLTLRDIKKLKEVLNYYSKLGMSFNNSFALDDFCNQRRPENILMGLGINATHKFFKQNNYLDPFKELILKNLDKNKVLKKISKLISNQGLTL